MNNQIQERIKEFQTSILQEFLEYSEYTEKTIIDLEQELLLDYKQSGATGAELKYIKQEINKIKSKIEIDFYSKKIIKRLSK